MLKYGDTLEDTLPRQQLKNWGREKKKNNKSMNKCSY